jgi:hypothetical protein
MACTKPWKAQSGLEASELITEPYISQQEAGFSSEQGSVLQTDDNVG